MSGRCTIRIWAAGCRGGHRRRRPAIRIGSAIFGSGTSGSSSTVSAPIVKVPMLAKGIVTAEDARLCLEHGVDGIYVSNHGGRRSITDPRRWRCCPKLWMRLAEGACHLRQRNPARDRHSEGAGAGRERRLPRACAVVGRWVVRRRRRAARAGDFAGRTGAGYERHGPSGAYGSIDKSLALTNFP